MKLTTTHLKKLIQEELNEMNHELQRSDNYDNQEFNPEIEFRAAKGALARLAMNYRNMNQALADEIIEIQKLLQNVHQSSKVLSEE